MFLLPYVADNLVNLIFTDQVCTYEVAIFIISYRTWFELASLSNGKRGGQLF